MTWRRRAIAAGVVLSALYVIGITIGSYYLTSRLQQKLIDRLELHFGGVVTVGSMDVSLWRGTAEARDIAISPGADGLASGRIDGITASFPRGGLVLLSRELHDFNLGEVKISLPFSALTKMRRSIARRPLWANRVTIARIDMEISASASLPGILSSRVGLERVVAGRTELRSAVFWLQSVRRMQGHLSVPLVGSLAFALDDKSLSLSGTMLPRPIVVAYDPPPAQEGATDGERVRGILRYVAANIAKELGGAWIGEQWRSLWSRLRFLRSCVKPAPGEFHDQIRIHPIRRSRQLGCGLQNLVGR